MLKSLITKSLNRRLYYPNLRSHQYATQNNIIFSQRHFLLRQYKYKCTTLLRSRSSGIDPTFLATRKQFLNRARLISITGVLVSIAFASSVWSDIRTSQLKGWVLRCMDTFELLDALTENDLNLLKLLRESSTKKSDQIETSWMGISTIANSIQHMFSSKKEISTIDLRDHSVFRSLSRSGVDLAAIFDEEETGSIPLNRLIYGLTIMHILSQDKSKSSSLTLDEPDAHEISWMTLVNLSGQRKKDEQDFKVPASEVQAWIEATSCLGIVRGYEFLKNGGLLSAGPCSKRLYEKWKESHEITSDDDLINRSQFQTLLSKVEYGMFWNRNQTTYRTIEFYKKRKREIDHKLALKHQQQQNEE